jgi:uncharacterized protein
MDRGFPRDFKDCKDFGKVTPFNPTNEAVDKEIGEAAIDLDTAKKSFDDGNYKWATTQAYYSMFLSARAALYSKGYRDRKHNAHLCLSYFLKRLVEQGYINSVYANDFMVAMDLRDKANYDAIYSRDTAEKAIAFADEFIVQMRAVIERADIRV